MNKAELNNMAAERLGIQLRYANASDDPTRKWPKAWLPLANDADYWTEQYWNPCSDRNQIAEYIYPEIEKRELWMQFFYALAEKMHRDEVPDINAIQRLVFSFGEDLLKIDPALIVEAFCEVTG
jgi:hypothetical protein